MALTIPKGDPQAVQAAVKQALKCNPHQFPKPLKKAPFWITWKPTPQLTRVHGSKDKGSKAIKISKVPTTAEWQDNQAPWSEIQNQVGFGFGFGFVYSQHHPFVCIDVDTITPDTLAIIAALDSYTEVSPSGQGLHVVVSVQDKQALIQLYKNKQQAPNIDLFIAAGYVTVTGIDPSGTPTPALKNIKQSTQTPIREITTTVLNDILAGTFKQYIVDLNTYRDEKQRHTSRPKATDNQPSLSFIRSSLAKLPVIALHHSLFDDLLANDEVRLDPDCTDEAYEPWLTVGQALHHYTNGSPAGFQIWDEWSSNGNKYDQDTCVSKWQSFGLDPSGGSTRSMITIGTILKLIKRQDGSYPDLDRKGKILPTAENVKYYLHRNRIYPMLHEITNEQRIHIPLVTRVRWGMRAGNTFEDYPPIKAASELIAMDWSRFDMGSKQMTSGRISAALKTTEYTQHINPVREYFESLVWDGKDRLSQLYSTIIPIDKRKMPTYETFIRKWMIQVVAAACHKVSGSVRLNRVLIFTGAQGIGKTRWVESLFPQQLRRYCLGDKVLNLATFRTDAVKLAMELTSTLICNINEIDQLFTGAHYSTFKAFLDQTTDNVVLPYGEAPVNMNRRTVFIGSCNERRFLKDITGNRRFEIIDTVRLDADHAVSVDQLWAQVFSLYQSGEKWWLEGADATNRDKINIGHTSAPNASIMDELVSVFDTESPIQYHKGYQLKDLRAMLGISPAHPRSKETQDLKNSILLFLQGLPQEPTQPNPRKLYPDNPNSPVVYFMPPLAELGSSVPTSAAWNS